MDWNTTDRCERTRTRYAQEQPADRRDPTDPQSSYPDYGAKSCADYQQLSGRGPRDVESLTMLSGIEKYDAEPSELDEDQNK